MVTKKNKIQRAIKTYISNINNIYQSNNYTEYTYRRDFGNFLTNIIKYSSNNNKVSLFEEHKHYINPRKYNGTDKNAPDYTLYNNNDLTIGVLETKLPDATLLEPKYQKQFNRYKNAFSFVIFSNYLKFSIWENGNYITTLNVGTITRNNRQEKEIVESAHALSDIKQLITYILSAKPQRITSTHKLAIILANLSKLLSDDVNAALVYDEDNKKSTTLTYLFESFRIALIKDITPKMFADCFAQTIAYGMLSAKLHYDNRIKFNNTSKNIKINPFSRAVALDNIPRTDSFLNKLFSNVAGEYIDSRIKWCVEAIANVFNAVQSKALITNNSHLIDFYETYLKNFDNKARKERGVWYTPKEIANFIVNSVDELLINKLSLKHGLATPKVKILDPATGTGTFLCEVINKIHNHFKDSNIQSNSWLKYVRQYLPNQLNAFEILMASYTIAHINVYLTLLHSLNVNELPKDIGKLNIFLTNSLIPASYQKNLLLPYISHEEEHADKIKASHSIMVILGNPPYNRKSQNNNHYINNLMKSYVNGLGNIPQNGVRDDYVKFIRLAEEYIHNRKRGIIGFITNSSYLNGPACKIMRKHLARTFDNIYVINLHGGKEEKNLKNDESVFNIKIPVAISIFVKNTNSTSLAKIHYTSISGSRNKKLSILSNHSVKDVKFHTWKCSSNNDYKFMYEKSIKHNHYEKFIPVTQIFNTNQNGIITCNDNLLIHDSLRYTKSVLYDLNNKNINYIRKKYNVKDDKSWHLLTAKREIDKITFSIQKINYRPLDYRYVPYSLQATSNKVLYRPCTNHMSDMLLNKNYYKYPILGLVIPSQISTDIPYNHAIITKSLITNRVLAGNRGGGFIFPFQANTNSSKFEGNITPYFLKMLNKRLNEKIVLPSYSKCRKVLAWIIAILNAPQYLKKYNDKLKDHFARIPLPYNQKQFDIISKVGNKLIDDYTLTNQDTKYYGFKGNNTNWTISDNYAKLYDPMHKRLYINKTHYIKNVSPLQYNYNIAGYNVIRQWLKDRRGKDLTQLEIEELQKILSAIKDIDKCKNKLKSFKSINKF